MSFEDVHGQGRAADSLRNAIKNGKSSHAYIFAGPPGCGRSLLARNFAKALNCERDVNGPCDSCPSCRKIDNDSHPDVKWIRKDSDSRQVKIDQIRALEGEIVLKPYEGRYKVFIIAEAGLMNIQASNSFLKTLEEPPQNSIIVLIAQKPKDLLPTIVSRCQLVRLRPVEKYGSFELKDEVLDEFSDDSRIDDYSADEREELSGKLKALASWYRDLLVFKATWDKNLLIYPDRVDSIEKETRSRRVDELMDMFESVVSAKENVENNVNPKLALSAMFKEII